MTNGEKSVRQLRGGQYVSPQLDATAMQRLVDAGVRLVVNNRQDGEEAGQPDSESMAAAAAAAGLGYLHLPVAGGLDAATIAAARDALAQAPAVVFYCKSGFRSALLWAAASVAGGEEPEGVIADARNAGFELSPYRPLLAQVQAAFSSS